MAGGGAGWPGAGPAGGDLQHDRPAEPLVGQQLQQLGRGLVAAARDQMLVQGGAGAVRQVDVCQAVAEVGRQPWAIQGLLPVNVATTDIGTGSVQTTFFMFLAIFTLLLVAEIKIMLKQIKIGPEGL